MSRRSYRQSSVIKDFGQWVVTRYGVECSEEYYAISRRDITDPNRYPVEKHMAEKNWVSMYSLNQALAYVRGDR